jgi:hypothetical protein
MERAEAAGGTITVIRSRDGQILHEEAELVSIDASTVTLDGDASPWQPGEPVVLLRPQSGGMAAAPAVTRTVNGGRVTLDVLRAWAPLNRRKAPRYATRLTASIRDRATGEDSAGRLLDISLGGARLELDRRPSADGVELVLKALGQQATIPCRVIDTGALGVKFETRLTFSYVFPEDQALLEALVHLMGTIEGQGRDLLAVQ